MDRIETCVLKKPSNTKMAPFLARLTQRGHEIHSIDDLVDLYDKDSSQKFKDSLAALDHGTIKRFDQYVVAVVGASRRFLAQIRTHQHADFVSASLQYSDFSKNNPEEMFVVPYEIIEKGSALRNYYLDKCNHAFLGYQTIAKAVGNDAAGFALPNGARNILIMQGNAQEWQYMISLRTCRRNSAETRYVMLRIWEELLKMPNGIHYFKPGVVGPGCMCKGCTEGHMCCGDPVDNGLTPTEILQQDFPLLVKDEQ